MAARGKAAMTVKLRFALLLIAGCMNLLYAAEDPSKNATSPMNSGRRILGGKIAHPAEFRFLVRLEKGKKICSGNVVSSKWILTAAFCTFRIECPAIKIFPSNWEPGNTPTIHGVLCFTPEEYPRVRYAYEISLIKTREDLLEEVELSVIPLPPPGVSFGPGTACVIAGWGDADAVTGESSDGLRRATVRILDHELCNDAFKRTDPECGTEPTCPVSDIPNRVLCSDGASPKLQGICHGDAGGPLLVDGVLAGVAIAAVVQDGKCVLGSPSIYTNVADFLPWIYSYIDHTKDTSDYPVKPESTAVVV